MADSTRENFQRFINLKGLQIRPWARDAGVADGTIRSYLKGRSVSLTHATLEKLAKAAGVTVEEMLASPDAHATTQSEHVPQQDTEETSPDATILSDLVAVRHLEVHASAGGGFTVEREPDGEPFYFRKSWLEQKFGGHDGKLRIVHFDGDSMLPTIHSGDLGLILTGLEQDDFRSGHIYVLWDGNGLVVKRLETVLGDRPRLRVISDNKALYAPYEIDAANARIVGRVLWRGGDL